MDLTATLDGETTYKDADYIVIVVSTDYNNRNNFFDCLTIETVIEIVLNTNLNVQSTVLVGCTEHVRAK